MTRKPEPAARLEIIVEFDSIPDMEELSSTVDTLRGEGSIVTAELTILRETVVNLNN